MHKKALKINIRPSYNSENMVLRAAVLLVTGALTINPESIFSGNIA